MATEGRILQYSELIVLRRIAIRTALLIVALGAAAYGARALYNRYDQQIYRFVESHPSLRDFRNHLRFWPHPSEYLVCESIAPSPVPRFESPGVVVDGRVFVFGGFVDPSLRATSRNDVYDPRTDSWTQLAPMPATVTHVGIAVVGRQVWFAGGFAGDHPGPAVSDVWKYDIDTDTWSPQLSLPEPRAGGGLALLDGRLHYFGGSELLRSSDSSDHWVLDLESPESWIEAAPFPGPRHHFGTATLFGKAYAIGGQVSHDRSGRDFARVDVYDPASGSWSAAAALPRPRSHIEPGTFVWNGQVCVAGGEVGVLQALYDIDCYDPQTDVWQSVPALPEQVRAPIVQSLGDDWFVATGGAMPSGMRPSELAMICRQPTPLNPPVQQ